mgnify:CR=1 FL=1
MDGLQLKLCDIQGRLFELSGANGYDSATFIKAFMTGDVAKGLDSKFNRMQWAGEEYLLEEILEAAGDKLTEKGEVYSKDVIYWIGYIYRYWHYYTEESSKAIYKQAPVETMKRNYLMFHTMAPEVAIEDLKEKYNADCYVMPFDVCDRDSAAAALKALPEEWQSIDVLINNAGLAIGVDKEYEGNLDEWDVVIDTNVKALLSMTRLVVPGMVERGRGHIINIGSIAGDAAYPGGSVYCATKAAVKVLSDGLRIDLVDTPLRVTNI